MRMLTVMKKKQTDNKKDAEENINEKKCPQQAVIKHRNELWTKEKKD